MTDIVERLRGHPGPDDTVTAQFRTMVEQRHEAAAEVERLRADNKEMRGALIQVRARFQRLRLGPDEEQTLDRVNAALGDKP